MKAKASSFLEQAKQIVDCSKKTSSPLFATWYDDKGKQVDEYTFQSLWDEAGCIAHALRNKWGANKGDLVVLCYDFGIHFFAAFIGCLRAGVTAVIVYPPSPPLVKSLGKMKRVIEDCSPVLILTDSKVNLFRKADLSNPFSKSRHLWPSNLTFKVTTNISKSMQGNQFDEPNIEPSDLAFLQYTSGSTGNPKGVMVTHGALHANVQVLGDNQDVKFRNEGIQSQDVVGFSWLPQYHDLGLIGFFITPFAKGWRMHMMSPITFIKNPLLWIDLMSQHKVHFSAGPDFAYQLVSRKFKEAKRHKAEPITNLDLSSICYLINAAEPIKLDTKDKFVDAFGDYGLSKDWFTTSYGLAESVVGVSWLNYYFTGKEGNCEGEALSQSSYAVAVGERDTLHPSVAVKIVDPDTRIEMNDGQSGEIWVSGPSVAAGYYGKPELSQETFQAQVVDIPANNNNNNCNEDGTNNNEAEANQNFLRTGDKGFFKDGRLFICGRYKDLIIVNGVNYYPHDIEHLAQEASTAVRPGCCAAFSSSDASDSDELVVVFEIRTNMYKCAKQVCLDVQSSISNQIGLIATVVAVKERSICKTTSGKIQRRQNRIFFNEGKLQIVHNISSQPHIASSSSTSPAPATATEEHQELTLDDYLKSLFGQNIQDSQSWDELGLTSMQSVELSNFVAQDCGVQLPPNFTDLYPTIQDLKDYTATSQGKPIDVSLPDLTCRDTSKMSRINLMLLQLVGFVMLLVMITAPMIPAVYFAKAFKWYLVPLIFPIWMCGYTILLIIAKWIVIGTYKEQEIAVPSKAFVRWWFVDRAVFVWNAWVGHFILDSPLQWLVYTLLGAKIHPSVQINTLMQEFDLIQIGKNVSISSSSLRCSKFAHVKNNGGVLQLRPITVQANCQVDGYLSSGVVVGKGSVVEIYSMVANGSQIPENSIIRGNPAHQFGLAKEEATTSEEEEEEHMKSKNSSRSWWYNILKLVSYVVFLYVSFGCLGLGTIVVRGILITNWEWRYAPLVLMFLSILVGIVISVLLNILLKWTMIGKRRPGPYNETLFTTFTEWFVDYHFQISSHFLGDLTSNSRSWNLIMKLYGMNVDFASHVIVYNFPPSKVDLISMTNTFSSAALYKVKKNGYYFETKLIESSIGWNAYIAPGVEISQGTIAPLVAVTQDVIKDAKDIEEDAEQISLLRLLSNWILIDLAYICLFGMVVLATIPVYELCILFFHDLSLWMIIPVGSLLIVVQSIMMLLVLNLLQLFTYGGTNTRSEPWNYPLHLVSVTANWSMQRYNASVLTWGTPMFNMIATFLGSTFKGNEQVLFWGFIYDFPYISFEGNTIVDNGNLCGHHAVYHKMVLGKTTVSGIIHPMTFTMANVSLTENESGPWRAPSSKYLISKDSINNTSKLTVNMEKV